MRSTITFTLLSAAVAVIAAPLPDGGSAYTGAGGQAVGGSKWATDHSGNGLAGGLDALSIASDNAGDGGKATSGTAVGGNGYKGHGGNAYSGVGGNSNGGNIVENHYPRGGLGYYGWDNHGALDDADILNIASGNAGDGGDSSSGNAYGGNSFGQ